MAENDGLVELAQAGKRAGFEGLFHAYAARVQGFALRMLADANGAQDVVVAAYKAVFREIVTFTSASGVLVKLYERAYAECLRLAPAVSGGDPEWRDVDPDAVVDDGGLLAAMKGVSPCERGLWLLKLDGLADVEVAFAAGMNVKSPDVGGQVTSAIGLAKRQFLAGLSTAPSTDAAKASEVADQLGLMLPSRPVPPQVWATIDRTLRAERIVPDEAPEPRRSGGDTPFPWWILGALALAAGFLWIVLSMVGRFWRR